MLMKTLSRFTYPFVFSLFLVAKRKWTVWNQCTLVEISSLWKRWAWLCWGFGWKGRGIVFAGSMGWAMKSSSERTCDENLNGKNSWFQVFIDGHATWGFGAQADPLQMLCCFPEWNVNSIQNLTLRLKSLQWENETDKTQGWIVGR